ncbi:hypothetical protein CSKR_112109 [Clonorchis sinensis]|uniref:Uncharacterized protein n=1 Tax=Clonorchis sinensis TaxID=79923 RepID=A0A419PCD2_CLOSI|nr:hypothetical protein CSKR_112109 [Clonorchis sinensis]
MYHTRHHHHQNPDCHFRRSPHHHYSKTITSVFGLSQAAEYTRGTHENNELAELVQQLRLPFKGDSVAEIITRRLRNSVDTTYMAANLYLSFNSSPTISFRLKDKLLRSTTSFCVYSYVCSCRASCVGRTIRHLSDRMRELNPISLSGSWKKSGSSAIASHLAETNHAIDHKQASTLIYRAPLNRSRLVRSRLVSIAEAIGIRLQDPQLCVQKKLVRPLNLNWHAKNPFPQASLTLTSLT